MVAYYKVTKRERYGGSDLAGWDDGIQYDFKLESIKFVELEKLEQMIERAGTSDPKGGAVSRFCNNSFTNQKLNNNGWEGNMKKDLIQLSLDIATKAHEGQFRRDGKTPYITHPMNVASKFYGQPPWEKFEILVCSSFLHDILEDTKVTEKDLFKAGIPERIINVVQLLTKKKNQPYLDYLLKIKTNDYAVKVKIADIKHNMETSSGNQKDKYLLALYILGH